MEDKKASPTTKRTYRKSLGLFELVGFGLGGTIGSGIFIVPGIAASIAGPSSILAWIFACTSASSIMYALAKTSSKYPSTGAFYSIFSQVFNKRISVFVVLMYIISCVFGIAAIASGIGQYVYSLAFGDFRDTTNTHITNATNRSTTSSDIITLLFIVEMMAILAFCLINIKGVFISGKAESVLTIVKVAPLIMLSFLLLPYIRESNFVPFFPSYTSATSGGIASNSSFLKALVIVYFPLTGFEICAIPVAETKGGEKTVYRSMQLVIGIVVFIYIFLNISLIGSVGSAVLANSPAPIATASGLILKQSQSIVALIGIVAMLSAINAYMLAGSRVLQNITALSYDNHHLHFINQLKVLSSKGTPAAAIMVVTFASCISLILFSGHFEELAEISVIATNGFVCLSAYKMFSDNTRIRIIAAAGALSTFAIIVIYFGFQILR
jgi:amino acid transporter